MFCQFISSLFREELFNVFILSSIFPLWMFFRFCASCCRSYFPFYFSYLFLHVCYDYIFLTLFLHIFVVSFIYSFLTSLTSLTISFYIVSFIRLPPLSHPWYDFTGGVLDLSTFQNMTEHLFLVGRELSRHTSLHLIHMC